MYYLNLVPWREKNFKKYLSLAIVMNLIFWLACLLSSFMYIHSLHISDKQKNIRQIEKKITAINQQSTQLKKLEQAKKKVETLKQINMDLLTTLVQLSQFIPANVRLDSINITPTEMMLMGQASNQIDMTGFSQSIFNLQYFNKQKSWAISERPTDVEFKLVLTHEKDPNNSI